MENRVIHLWETFEITLYAENKYENYYTEVCVWAHLKGPGFDKKCFGFWMGIMYLEFGLQQQHRDYGPIPYIPMYRIRGLQESQEHLWGFPGQKKRNRKYRHAEVL